MLVCSKPIPWHQGEEVGEVFASHLRPSEKSPNRNIPRTSKIFFAFRKNIDLICDTHLNNEEG